MHADRIFVLEQGQIIENGRHEDLIAEKGLYYAMWRQQVGERKKSNRYKIRRMLVRVCWSAWFNEFIGPGLSPMNDTALYEFNRL